jgi:hypothetical protein
MEGAALPDMPNNHKRNRRRHARRHLSFLYAKQNSLCHWCKSQTVIAAHIPPANIIKLDNCVVWTDGDYTYSARIATTDHVQPMHDDGSDRIDNLVMACGQCNSHRTPPVAARNATREVIRAVCVHCHSDKPRRYKHCLVCQQQLQMEWLASHGWTTTIDPTNGYEKWRDPKTGDLHISRWACKIQSERTGPMAWAKHRHQGDRYLEFMSDSHNK